jgi:hypothetical protein
MTMPHLENCPHGETGRCLACVREMGEEHDKEIEREIARVIERLTGRLNTPPSVEPRSDRQGNGSSAGDLDEGER